jgi:hypothetical protein
VPHLPAQHLAAQQLAFATGHGVHIQAEALRRLPLTAVTTL